MSRRKNSVPLEYGRTQVRSSLSALAGSGSHLDALEQKWSAVVQYFVLKETGLTSGEAEENVIMQQQAQGNRISTRTLRRWIVTAKKDGSLKRSPGSGRKGALSP